MRWLTWFRKPKVKTPEEWHSALAQEVLSFVAAHPAHQPASDAAFNTLAKALFAWQRDRVGAYRRLCEARSVTVKSVKDWRQIPAVPTEVFKDFPLFAWRPDEAVRVFRTSGTVQGHRGNHFFRTLRCYNAGLWPMFRAFVLPEWEQDQNRPPPLCLFLLQAPSEQPDSSLAHMLGEVVKVLEPAQRPFCLSSAGLDHERIAALIAQGTREGRPVLAAGSAFALARCFEEAEQIAPLPPGSRVMETGGFKGHQTDFTRESLYAAIMERWGVPEPYIVSEYGMTELSSQCYHGSLRAAVVGDVADDGLVLPPWLRVRIVSPDTGDEVAPGEIGLIQLHDLLNIDAVSAVYTADQGRIRESGTLELLGRLPGAERRGCSLAAAEVLGEG